MLVCLGCISQITLFAMAQSTIDPARAHSWSPSIGWINWHSSPQHGAVIGEFVCSGYLWSPNIGWIHLGNGQPANGIRYSNASGSDYGVNHDGAGGLGGLAWSANIGWVMFEDQGNPRFDIRSGRLSGYAWMPNAGWLRLGDATANWGAVTTRIAPGRDTIGDGIPDAWKLLHGGSLDSLRAHEDASGNGMTNREAYLAGLDPFDAEARFEIVHVEVRTEPSGVRYEIEWTSTPLRDYRLWFSPDLENWERIGPLVILPEVGKTTRFARVLQEPPPSAFFRVQVLRPLQANHE
jgi:hypothetical protein